MLKGVMDISFSDPSESGILFSICHFIGIKYRVCHNWATCQSQCVSPLGQDRVQGCGYEQKQQCGESANDDILLSRYPLGYGLPGDISSLIKYLLILMLIKQILYLVIYVYWVLAYSYLFITPSI